MISFYRDFLDGTVYSVVALISVIFIIAIIGFMMEKIKAYKEEQAKIAYIKTKEDEQRGGTIIFDSKTDMVKTKVTSPQEENTELKPNTPPEEEIEDTVNRRDEVMTIDSSTLDVPEIIEESTENQDINPEEKVEDLTKVIDFGSTDDVKIDEL